MPSTWVLADNLRSITNIKLHDLSEQRATFEESKGHLLFAVDAESDLSKKVKTLLDGCKGLSDRQRGKKSNPFYDDLTQHLEQSKFDPSISETMSKGEAQLRRELDVRSLRYEYAFIHSQLLTEWLADDSNSGNVLWRKRMWKGNERLEHKKEWESYVFQPLPTNQEEITDYLTLLFGSTPETRTSLEALRKGICHFEETLTLSDQVKEEEIRWCFNGLLHSDLLNEAKKGALTDMSKHKESLDELADVLNMRLSSIQTWAWEKTGIVAEERRQITGKYRIFHDEDIIDSLLLEYLGRKWSVKFKSALATLPQLNTSTLTQSEKERREYFLGPDRGSNLSKKRDELFRKENFMSQLLAKEDKVLPGYEDYDQDDEITVRRSHTDIKHSLLHLLSTEIVLNSRLHKNMCIIRSDFKRFGPSLAHSTIFAVLKFFGVSPKWLGFFRNALEVPIKFDDDPEKRVRVRKRGTAMSSPLADVFSEVVLFSMDRAVNHNAKGANLHRLHDDFWIWGSGDECVKAWHAVTEFTRIMGLDINMDKSGSVLIARNKVLSGAPASSAPAPHRNSAAAGSPPGSISSEEKASLPSGNIAWGFLLLDAQTGRFKIDGAVIEEHVNDLRLQLKAEKSILGYIKLWNHISVRFFTSMLGKPANCLGQAHVDMVLEAFKRVQKMLFPSSGNVNDHLKGKISRRFNVQDIPDGFLYFPLALGGLDLQSPFIPYLQVRSTITQNPQTIMDDFFSREKEAYERAKAAFEKDRLAKRKKGDFMSFDQYTRNREQTSPLLLGAYEKLLAEPKNKAVRLAFEEEVKDLGGLSDYQRWVLHLYGAEMINRFGGLRVVEKRLLPTGLVQLFRQRRMRW